MTYSSKLLLVYNFVKKIITFINYGLETTIKSNLFKILIEIRWIIFLAKDFKKYGVNENYIISIASQASRMKTLKWTLKSIILQSTKPSSIYIWFNKRDFKKAKCKFCNYKKYGVKIMLATIDYKSHNKYFYSLKKFSKNGIVTADDDLYYRKNWLRELINANNEVLGQKVIVGHRGVNIHFSEPNKIDLYCLWKKASKTNSGVTTVLNSGAGILFPPESFTKFDFSLDISCSYPNLRRISAFLDP